MQNIDFPIFKTKIDGITKKFDLSDSAERKKYFSAKGGESIEKIKKYLKKSTFVAYLLGKKNSGKGTYSKLFIEAIGADNILHISVGDVVRDIHKNLSNAEEKVKFLNFFKKNYRGAHTVEQLENIITNRDTASLISSELIVALIKYEISKYPRSAIFFDGFPRAHDQINYSLFLKDLIGYREDPDFFVFIDVAESVIDERIKYRVICPNCQTPRNLRVLATKNVGYDSAQKEFYLMCDNAACDNARLAPKEGDNLGIEPIRKRLETDEEVMKKLLSINGISKIYIRNTIPVDKAKDYVDDYEITPGYYYELNQDGRTKTIEKPWAITDDNGVLSYSLLPAAVELALLKQIADIL